VFLKELHNKDSVYFKYRTLEALQNAARSVKNGKNYM